MTFVPSTRQLSAACGMAAVLACLPGSAHDHSKKTALKQVALAQAKADAAAETVASADETSELTLQLIDDWTKEPTAGLVRITNDSTGKAIKLENHIHRALNWYAIDKNTTLSVPRTRLKIEALRGLETKLSSALLDLTPTTKATFKLPLTDIYDARERGWYSGNTHLHLMNLTHAEADRYLRVVPQADDLDLVFLSYLRRIPDERNYISNQIVENSFAGGDLQRLSQHGVLFANGEEHRHNFGPGGEGYGHVMLLDLRRLIRPVSIGPGIMREGTDGLPLRQGIQAARADDSTVIWCHNTFGFEDLPNWVAGLIHAQNIFDGGNHGGYADTFYRYLNVGMRVPFSTGTDWFIYDFSRVYVSMVDDFSTDNWLAALREGRSYITNGPLLELETERAHIGDTLEFDSPNQVTVVARGTGRLDFKSLELVHNGEVVHTVPARLVSGQYIAEMRHGLEVEGPGWFALRIPPEAGTSELDRPLFAHTSPIYIRFQGREIFERKLARGIVEEMKTSMKTIRQKGHFADDTERERVLQVYQQGIEQMEARIKKNSKK